ncbi:MAG: amino acid adenylation domain-containing protein, partial [Chloroflexi bacterium]|nr:amino acid adenylation domain-containing protein [Chloroflexota bacterium]
MTKNTGTDFNFSGTKLELLDLLLADEGLTDTAVPTIVSRPQTNSPVPLSFAQQRLWFLSKLTPDSPLFNTPLVIQLSGMLNKEAVKKACQALVQRHESLRTTFTAVSDVPQQFIHENWPIVLHQTEIAAAESETVLQTAIWQPFDLEKGPLLRFHLFQISQTEHILLLVFHHIVFDGWSAGIIWDEFASFYEAFAQNKMPQLAEMPIQYADFASWQRDWLVGDRLQTQLDYWQMQLAGDLPILQLPSDNVRPTVKTHHGALETAVLSTEIMPKIETLSQQTGITSFMLLLATFKVLLFRYTSQKDILVGTPIANRQQTELEGLVGFFVNTLVMRSQLDGQQTFRQLLSQIRETATSAYDHQDIPFEKLVELLQPKRNLSFDPLFQVMFAYQDEDLEERSFDDLSMTHIDIGNGIAQFDMTLFVSNTKEQFSAAINYNTDLFTPEAMGRMLVHWQMLLDGLIAHPDMPIGQISLLAPSEHQKIVVEWNQTTTKLPSIQLAHELIAQQAVQTPDAPALVFAEQQMSYAELNGRSNQLAHALQAKGIGPEEKVGVFINRSFEMVIAVLAVFKAGGAYVPLDPTYPAERLVYMMADADLSIILTSELLLSELPTHVATVLCLDQDWQTQVAHQPKTNPISEITVSNLAYIIYTSGSTGRPKGVAVTHRGVVNMGQGLGEAYAVTSKSRLLQFASFSFDASVAEIIFALQNGATLVLANKDDLLMGPSFVQLMQHQRVTVATLPPSALALLSPDDFPLLETVASVGEACSAEIVTRWAQGRHFVNGYGPTEGTVGAITAALTPNDPRPVIGRPLPNYQVYLLNDQLQPVPVGVAGEIHIAGIGLARGYLNRPDLTAEKFISNPFANNNGERMYKTGDLGRYLPDGRIEFLGRVDHQVKIRGFRIELGEIEAVLRQHTAVQDVLVLAKDNDGDAQLVAYLLGDAAEIGNLRPFLSKLLPDYLIPAAFVTLESFPLTPNGKIDRKALPAANGHLQSVMDGAFIAPQDALEFQLSRIWQETLNLPAISTDVNYFEIGGHSLQAVTLFAAIEKKMKVRLPVALLFQAPTILQLAEVMREQGNVVKWSSLVPIQPLGSKTPFFCVHGGAGHVFHYHDLAQLLGTERPFYGLQPIVNETTHQSIYTRVEEMASRYIEEIKMVQPEGPYLLGGFCFGGIVVYEIAQQLTKAGDEVGLLALIDPSSPQNKPEPETLSSEFLAVRITRHQKSIAQLDHLARLRYVLNSGKNRLLGSLNLLYRTWLRAWLKVRIKLLQKYIDWKPLVSTRFHDFYFMHLISSPATEHYYPRQYMGEAILFSSTLENAKDEFLGWENLPQ